MRKFTQDEIKKIKEGFEKAIKEHGKDEEKWRVVLKLVTGEKFTKEEKDLYDKMGEENDRIYGKWSKK